MIKRNIYWFNCNFLLNTIFTYSIQNDNGKLKHSTISQTNRLKMLLIF